MTTKYDINSFFDKLVKFIALFTVFWGIVPVVVSATTLPMWWFTATVSWKRVK